MDELAGADAASLEEKFRLLHERQEEQEARILAGVKQLLLEHGGGLQSRTGLYGNPVKVPMGEGAPNNYGTKAHRVPLSAPKVPPVVPSGIPFHVVTENHHQNFKRGFRGLSPLKESPRPPPPLPPTNPGTSEPLPAELLVLGQQRRLLKYQ